MNFNVSPAVSKLREELKKSIIDSFPAEYTKTVEVNRQRLLDELIGRERFRTEEVSFLKPKQTWKQGYETLSYTRSDNSPQLSFTIVRHYDPQGMENRRIRSEDSDITKIATIDADLLFVPTSLYLNIASPGAKVNQDLASTLVSRDEYNTLGNVLGLEPSE